MCCVHVLRGAAWRSRQEQPSKRAQVQQRLVSVQQRLVSVKCEEAEGEGAPYLFLVRILKSRSQTRWCRQMVRQMVRLTCSYQHAMDAPNAIGGHTRRGATRRITYCVAAPASDSGTGK